MNLGKIGCRQRIFNMRAPDHSSSEPEQDEKPMRDGGTYRAKGELIEILRSCVRELLTYYDREEACRALFYVIDNEFKEAELI